MSLTPEQNAQRLAACPFINSHPSCASLLYDMDLMPEQVASAHTLGWMINVVQHFRETEKQERTRAAKVCRDLAATSAHPGECLFCADAIESPTEGAT